MRVRRSPVDIDVRSVAPAGCNRIADDTFSMARCLASRGDLVVTLGPPGVGGSDVPDDGYRPTPHV